mmetsp:Transcript_12538/g.26433  ORF Transcript_12538/g.26433 Transcript_12538/m.26433 type:complete len:202 (-) Transcript_12538:25-630(-)
MPATLEKRKEPSISSISSIMPSMLSMEMMPSLRRSSSFRESIQCDLNQGQWSIGIKNSSSVAINVQSRLKYPVCAFCGSRELALPSAATGVPASASRCSWRSCLRYALIRKLSKYTVSSCRRSASVSMSSAANCSAQVCHLPALSGASAVTKYRTVFSDMLAADTSTSREACEDCAGYGAVQAFTGDCISSSAHPCETFML